MAQPQFESPHQGGDSMTPQDLLAKHNIHLASTAPGRYYTTCPQCSAKRSKAHQTQQGARRHRRRQRRALGLQSLRLDRTGKGQRHRRRQRPRPQQSHDLRLSGRRAAPSRSRRFAPTTRTAKSSSGCVDPMAMAAGSKASQTSTPRCSIACPRSSRRSGNGQTDRDRRGRERR